MKILRNVLLMLTALLLLAACGGSGEPQQTTEAPVVEQPEVSTDDGSTQTEMVAETTDEEPPATAQQDTGDKIVLTQAEKTAPKVTGKFQAKTHYQKLTTAQGTSSPPDVIEVAEVFWYGCPHCFNFDPVVDNWAEELPEDVNFIRIPVMWNPTNAIHARLFYTLEALGKLDEVHEEVFTAMHVNNQMLTTEAEMIALVGKHGISEQEFRDTFTSFAVESKLKRAQNLTKRYRIQSVPILVVNGTYLTSGKGIKNFDDMLAVADELVAMEREDR